MRKSILAAMTALLLTASGAYATDWETRVIPAEAKASRCTDQATAETDAHTKAKRVSENQCRDLGYGWHLQELKSEGKLACNGCGESKTSCQITGQELLCRRLKPGSVGMGPLMGGDH